MCIRDSVPVPLPSDKVRGALADGSIDGMLISPSSLLSLKLYDVASYLSQVSLLINSRFFLISGHTWNRLPPKQRTAVLTAAREATAADRTLEAEGNDSALQQLAQHGMKIVPFEERAAMREKLRPSEQRLAASLGLADLLASVDREWALPAAPPARGRK